MTGLQLSISIGALVVLGAMLWLILARDRLGPLNAASWLVVLGALVILPEHPQFPLSYGVPFTDASPDAADLVMSPHARVHFVLAGVYAALGLALLCVIARISLRQGQRLGWFTALAALVLGTGTELLAGSLWFQHGAPWYVPFMSQVKGFGWEWLDLYPLAWLAALLIAYRPVFTTPRR
jgi:hypothetical protein